MGNVTGLRILHRNQYLCYGSGTPITKKTIKDYINKLPEAKNRKSVGGLTAETKKDETYEKKIVQIPILEKESQKN